MQGRCIRTQAFLQALPGPGSSEQPSERSSGNHEMCGMRLVRGQRRTDKDPAHSRMRPAEKRPQLAFSAPNRVRRTLATRLIGHSDDRSQIVQNWLPRLVTLFPSTEYGEDLFGRSPRRLACSRRRFPSQGDRPHPHKRSSDRREAGRTSSAESDPGTLLSTR